MQLCFYYYKTRSIFIGCVTIEEREEMLKAWFIGISIGCRRLFVVVVFFLFSTTLKERFMNTTDACKHVSFVTLQKKAAARMHKPSLTKSASPLV